MSSGTRLLACAHEPFEYLVGDCTSAFTGELFIELVNFGSCLQCLDEALEIWKVKVASSLRVSFL